MSGEFLRHTDHYLLLYQASVHTALFLGHLGMLYVVNILLCPSWTPLSLASAHRYTDNPPEWVHMLLSLYNVTMTSMLVSWAGRFCSSNFCNYHSILSSHPLHFLWNSMPIPGPLWLLHHIQLLICLGQKCYDKF